MKKSFMKPLTISLALIEETVISGLLHVSEVKNKRLNTIVIIDGRVTVGNQLVDVDYFSNGVLQIATTKKFLTFNLEGKLICGDRPLPGFSVDKSLGFYGERKLYFNGISEFQLCPDGSIGFESKCADPQKILLTYTEKFKPRVIDLL